MSFRSLVLQQVGAHHRRRGKRNDHGDDNGGRERDGKLAEEPADNSAHQQKRDKDGNQRNADGEDGEADLFRTLQRRGETASCRFPDGA